MGLLVALVLAFASTTDEFPTGFFSPAPDSDESIEQLSALIADTPDDPEHAEELSEFYSLRGIKRLFAGHSEEDALSDLSTALRLNPDNVGARIWRAECFERLGDPISAQADRLLIPRVDQPVSVTPSLVSFYGTYVVPTRLAWLLVAGVWTALVVINVLVGWPQKQETGSSLGPLLGASVVLATLGALPMAILAGYTHRNDLPSVWWLVGTCATTLSAAIGSRFLMPPVFLQQTKTKLPRVLDERFLSQVRHLATSMKVPVPLVRLWPSIDGSQRALAFAGTLHAPQLVVTDGILQRLEPAECDAIVAHELAHIANKSLWLLCMPLPLGCAATVAVLPVMSLSMAAAFGLAVHVGLKRLISQPVELDCDRRAARAIGFRSAIAALAKIHAVHPLQNSGLLSLLVYATSTHPSCAVRLTSLYDAAPADDRPENPPDRAGLARHRLVTIAALLIWAVVLVGTLAASIRGYDRFWMGVVLWGVTLTPFTLLLIASWKGTSLAQRRMGQKLWFVKPVLLAGAVALGILAFRSDAARRHLTATQQQVPYAGLLVIALMITAAGGLSLWLLVTSRRRKVLREFAVAFQVHDFRGALEICRNSPGVVRRSHLLRYNQAIAQAFCGDVAGAIADFETLWDDKPKFPLTGFALCTFLLDSDQPERVIEVTRRLSELLPGDPQPPFFEACAYRALKRLDNAEAACQRSIEIESRSGPSCALAAALAVDRGDIERAVELCNRARELSPGDVHVRIVEAEIALSRDSLEVAQAAVGRAIETIRANPLVALNSELRRLEELLENRLSPVVTEDIFLQ